MFPETMISAHLIKKVRELPSIYEREVEDYIDAILDKDYHTYQKPKRQLGLLKGKITMSDDFDEPLDDFKEYEL